MKVKTICATCKSGNIEYLSNNRCFCKVCQKEQDTTEKVIETPYERTRRAVYATGNRWAIENFNATHN